MGQRLWLTTLVSIIAVGQLRFKPLHASSETGEARDPYASLHEPRNERDEVGQPLQKRQRTATADPYNHFSRNWEAYWNDTVLPTAAEAERKLDIRMEWPSIWECQEIVLKLLVLAQIGPFSKLPQQQGDQLTTEEAWDMIKDDAEAQTYLKDRLSLREYSCYVVRDVARNLDAFGTAKAAPKTKTYAMDADATEDPAAERIDEGTAGGEFGGDIGLPSDDEDGERLRPGEAPAKVYGGVLALREPLTVDQCAKALSFHKDRTSKFVKEMISAGLLPLTKDVNAIQKSHRSIPTSPNAERQQQTGEIRKLADCLPTVSKEMLETQREAFDTKKKSGTRMPNRPVDSSSGETTSSITSASGQADDVQAHWEDRRKPSETMEEEIGRFEANVEGFKLSDEQRTFCRWFSQALDVAYQEELQDAPMTGFSCRHDRLCMRECVCQYL